jgi:hypothetical protein
MFKNFEDLQKFSKDQIEAVTASSATISKSVQHIATEATEFSKKSFETAGSTFEKLVGVKSLENAIQIQSEYAKSAYEALVAQSTKMGELYSGLAKEMMKPVEEAVAKVQAVAK